MTPDEDTIIEMTQTISDLNDEVKALIKDNKELEWKCDQWSLKSTLASEKEEIDELKSLLMNAREDASDWRKIAEINSGIIDRLRGNV